MKKTIAFLTVAAFGLALAAPAGATLNVDVMNSDDWFLIRTVNRNSNFNVNNTQNAVLNNSLTLNLNTGKNNVIAADDIHGGSIMSGAVNTIVTELSEVNTLNVEYTGDCGCDSSDTNVLLNMDDDFFIQENVNDNNNEVINTTANVMDTTNSLVNSDTGNNNFISGDEVEKDDAVSIISGDNNIDYLRDLSRNQVNILRHPRM